MDFPIWLQSLGATVAGAVGGATAATIGVNKKIDALKKEHDDRCKDFERRISTLESNNLLMKASLDTIINKLDEVVDKLNKYNMILEKAYQREMLPDVPEPKRRRNTKPKL